MNVFKTHFEKLPNYIQVAFFKVPQVVMPMAAEASLEVGAINFLQFVSMEPMR